MIWLMTVGVVVVVVTDLFFYFLKSAQTHAKR